MDDIPEEYRDLVAELIPSVASAIDATGGLCRLDVVCNDPQVRDIRSKLPKQEKGNKANEVFRMTKLLAAESEFFTLLDDNDKICTALAYEKDLVDANGEITSGGHEHLQELKRERLSRTGQIAAPGVGPRPMPAARPTNGAKGKGKGAVVPQRSGVQLSMQKTGDIRLLAKKLYDATLAGSDAVFNELVIEVRRARKNTPIAPMSGPMGNARNAQLRDMPKRPREQQGFAGHFAQPRKPVKAVETGSAEQQLEIEKLMRHCANALRHAPEQSMKLCILADQEHVKPMKSVLNGVSFARLFDAGYPQYFECDKDAANQTIVKLVDEPPRTGKIGSCPPQELPCPFKKRRLAGEA